MRNRADMKTLMARFMRDPKRGITIEAFAKLCGCDPSLLQGVFLQERFPLTRELQIRVNNAFALWESGRVRVESRSGSFHNTRVRIVAEEKPALRKVMKVELGKRGPKLVTGIFKRADYGV